MRQFYVALVLLIMRESFSCFLSHFDVLVVLMSQSFLCCISFYDIFVDACFDVASVALMF